MKTLLERLARFFNGRSPRKCPHDWVRVDNWEFVACTRCSELIPFWPIQRNSKEGQELTFRFQSKGLIK